MDRLSIINYFVEKNNYQDYCEIGVFTGYTLDGCKAKNKIGVDPQCDHYKGNGNIFCGTSDAFFAQLPKDKKFQIFFIDGLHESTQVDRDIQNALKHLNKGGTIVMHDCNPSTEEMTLGGTANGEWTGDVYKSFLNFLENEFVVIDGNNAGFRSPAKYDAYVVDTDYGVGIIKPLKFMPPIDDSEYLVPNANIRLNATEDWKVFDENRKGLLNLISPEEFLKKEAINQEDNV